MRPRILSKDNLIKSREILKHITCSICSDILFNFTRCANCCKHYCKQCIAAKVSELGGKCVCGNLFKETQPESIQNALIEDREFKCPNPECKQIVKYTECVDHSNKCPYELISCTNDQCHKKIQRKSLENHLKTECEFTLQECASCKQQIPRSKLPSHIQNCAKLVKNSQDLSASGIVICKKCNSEIKNSEFNQHELQCPKWMVQCKNCQAEFKREELEKHNCFVLLREQIINAENYYKKAIAATAEKPRIEEKKVDEKEKNDYEIAVKKMYEGLRVVICPGCKRMAQQCLLTCCYQCKSLLCCKCLEYCRGCKKSIMCPKCLTICQNCNMPLCSVCKNSQTPHCTVLHFFNFKLTHGAYIFAYDFQSARVEKTKFTYSFCQDAIIDSVLIDRTVYISGGKHQETDQYSNELVSLVFDYSLKFKQRNLNPMNEARCYHRLIAVGHKQIFCIGGLNSKGSMKSCEVYNVKKDIWRKIGNMEEERNRPTIWNTLNSIYVAGGLNVKQNSIEEYSIYSNMWKKLQIDIRQEKILGLGIGIECGKDSIIILDKENSVYEFIISSKTFKKHSEIKGDCTFAQTKPVCFQQRIYIFGFSENAGLFTFDAIKKSFKMIKDSKELLSIQ